MSAVWIKLLTILCFFCTAPSTSECSGVMWKNCGESITIQCRSKPNQGYLDVKKGLNEDILVFYKSANPDKTHIGKRFKGRLQENGVFPNIDILIKNLTSEDTGPYWCSYKQSNGSTTRKGTGSVLLVVTGGEDAFGLCHKSDLILMCVVISTAVLLSSIMGVLIWLIKTKTADTARKQRYETSSYVYEDMSATLRRERHPSASNQQI